MVGAATGKSGAGVALGDRGEGVGIGEGGRKRKQRCRRRKQSQTERETGERVIQAVVGYRKDLNRRVFGTRYSASRRNKQEYKPPPPPKKRSISFIRPFHPFFLVNNE